MSSTSLPTVSCMRWIHIVQEDKPFTKVKEAIQKREISVMKKAVASAVVSVFCALAATFGVLSGSFVFSSGLCIGLIIVSALRMIDCIGIFLKSLSEKEDSINFLKKCDVMHFKTKTTGKRFTQYIYQKDISFPKVVRLCK